ncbi:DotA/TraY family protein [Acidiferrobacter sp.]
MPLNTVLPSASAATHLLTPAPTDQSVGVLSNLFGIPNGSWHSLYYQAIGGLGNGSLFFTLLKDFDLVVLAFVTLMVLITMGIGAASTAHEGKTFGSRYHSLWTPLRSAFAMVLLAPIPGVGLSMIQGAVLLMVWFSIGGANYLATQATGYMAKNSGQLTSIATGGGQTLAKDVLQSEIAMQFFVNYEKSPPVKTLYTLSKWHSNANGGGGHYTLTFTTSGVKPTGGYLWGLIDATGISPGQFGKFTIKCTAKSSPMCTTQVSAIEQMIKTEAPYVVKLVNSSQAAAGSSSISATTKAATQGPLATDPTVINAGKAYDTAVAAAEQQVVSLAHPELMQAMDNINANVAHLGWWTLGMYYWDIAHVNAGVQAQIGQPPRWSGYNQAAIDKAMSSKTDQMIFAKIVTAAGTNLQAAQTVAGTGTGSSLLTKVFSSQGAWYAQIPAWTLLRGDPLSNLQSAGDIIVTTEIPAAIGAYATIRAVSGGANGESKGAGVFGEGTTWLTAGANAAAKAIGPYVMALIVGIFVVGAIWAYYLPSVPFILWTMAIIGWLIFLIEALIGAVIWAAGIALPEGEGIFGPRGDQGVMLFLNVMFRPALMVIGFFASFMLINTVGSLVGGSFAVFMGGMYSTSGSSVSAPTVGSTLMALNPITWVATAVIVSIIAVAMTHKIFGLITWIPENVMRWVGGQGVQLGEGQDEQKTRGSFAAVGGVIQKGGGKPDAKGMGGKKGPGVAGGEDRSESSPGDETGGKGGNSVAGGGEKESEAPPAKPE